MEIRTLQYFLAIAREGSISGAAEYLHITQPTLSRQMKELEDELEKQLFIRGKRHITLTEEGMILRRRAEEITVILNRTEAEIKASEEILTGDIYVGCSESKGMRAIAKAITLMYQKHPQVKIHVYTGKSEDITERLDEGLLDIGIVIEPVDLTKYDYFKLPFHNTWGILMRNDSEFASLNYITPDDLRRMPIIASSQNLFKNEIAGWLNGNERKLNIVGTYNLLLNTSFIIEESYLYALCLDNLINTEGTTLCFKPLEPRLEANMVAVWKKYQHITKINQAFFKIIHNVIETKNVE